MAFFFLTTTTYQPSTKDTYGQLDSVDTHGGEALVEINNWKKPARIFLEFDISDIPNDVTFSQGDLQLYYYSSWGTPSGKTVWAYKLTRTDWVETELTWDEYKAGYNWTTAGGDYVTSSPSGGSVNMPSSYGWVTWNIQAIIEDAYSESNNVEILVKYNNETSSNENISRFYSREYTGDTSLRPKLTVTYTAPVDNAILFSCNF